MSDELVEKVAVAIQSSDRQMGKHIVGWDALGPQTQAHYRFAAKAALDASGLTQQVETLTAELEHFVDIVDGTETTGFNPHVEQMLMDAAETARAALKETNHGD